MFETIDKTKDLANDIFLYLAENIEASSSFNDNSDIEYSFAKGSYADARAKAQSEHGRNLTLGKFDIPEKEVNKYDHVSFYLPTVYVSGGQFTRQEYWENMDDVYKIYILQRALSAPNGKPICGFLDKISTQLLKEKKIMKRDSDKIKGHLNELGLVHESGWISGIFYNSQIKVIESTPETVSEILYRAFTDAIYEGNGFDEAYKLTNDKYNEIN